MRFIAVLISLLLVSAGSSTAQSGFVEQPGDSLLFATATVVARAASTVETLWPGYWPTDQAFILTQPESTVLLVSELVPPTAFTLVPHTAIPKVLADRTYIFRGVHPDLSASSGNYFDNDYRLGNQTVTAVPLRDSLFGTLSFLFHEAFHAFQHDHFAPRSSSEKTQSGVFSMPEYNAKAEIERRMLAEALMMAAKDSLPILLRGYLAVRTLRNQTVPSAVQNLERELEMIEGSAHFMGYTAALLAMEGSKQRLAILIEGDLRRPLRSNSMFGDPDYWRHRSRVYGTGAAIALLLDRLGMEWQLRLQDGEPFDLLLAEAVDFDPRVSERLVQNVFIRFRYKEVLEQISGH